MLLCCDRTEQCPRAYSYYDLQRTGSYGFEYSDDDMSTGAVDIENEYYKAKGALSAAAFFLD